MARRTTSRSTTPPSRSSRSSPRFEGGKFALTTDGGKTAASNYAKNKRRLDRLSPGLAAWRLHDIRRSTATGLARLGIPLPTIEKILGHASGSFAGIVGVYQRHDFAEEKRRALEARADVVALASGEPAEAKVIKLREASGRPDAETSRAALASTTDVTPCPRMFPF